MVCVTGGCFPWRNSCVTKCGEKVTDLTIAISNRPIPDKGKEAALQENNAPYTEIGGSTELKTAIRYKLKQETSIVAKNEDIIISTGAK